MSGPDTPRSRVAISNPTPCCTVLWLQFEAAEIVAHACGGERNADLLVASDRPERGHVSVFRDGALTRPFVRSKIAATDNFVRVLR
jgi:hypothetical protein